MNADRTRLLEQRYTDQRQIFRVGGWDGRHRFEDRELRLCRDQSVSLILDTDSPFRMLEIQLTPDEAIELARWLTAYATKDRFNY